MLNLKYHVCLHFTCMFIVVSRELRVLRKEIFVSIMFTYSLYNRQFFISLYVWFYFPGKSLKTYSNEYTEGIFTPCLWMSVFIGKWINPINNAWFQQNIITYVKEISRTSQRDNSECSLYSFYNCHISKYSTVYKRSPQSYNVTYKNTVW